MVVSLSFNYFLNFEDVSVFFGLMDIDWWLTLINGILEGCEMYFTQNIMDYHTLNCNKYTSCIQY